MICIDMTSKSSLWHAICIKMWSITGAYWPFSESGSHFWLIRKIYFPWKRCRKTDFLVSVTIAQNNKFWKFKISVYYQPIFNNVENDW
jgi:hypothetical protein